MHFSRRDLLKAPAALALQPQPAPWHDRPMRWGQLTLVENDPPKLDVEYWLDYFKRCHAKRGDITVPSVLGHEVTAVDWN